MPVKSIAAFMAAALLAGAACSSAAAPSSSAIFPSTPYMTALSDSGALRIEVRTSPQPPARGTNSLELTIADASTEKPRDDLSVAVKPWMPAMNHGSSAIPAVTAEGGGKYLVTGVYLFMPGRWDLRISLSDATTDHAAPAFEIP